MTNPTCKGCLDRKPGCHDHCERFKAWGSSCTKQSGPTPTI